MTSQSNDPDRAIDLERAIADIADTDADVVSEPRFLQALSSASMWILMDKDHSHTRKWDLSANFLVLADDAGFPMLAAFTATEFAMDWCQRFPEFAFGMLLGIDWILTHIPHRMGIIVNPASPLQTCVAPENLQLIKRRH